MSFKTNSIRFTFLLSATLAGAALSAPMMPLPASAQEAKDISPGKAPNLGQAALWIEEKSIPELAAALADGSYTSEQLVQAYLVRIKAIDASGPTLNSVISLFPDAAEQACTLDTERQAGTIRGPLHGIPILIKDNIEAAGPVPTTAGSTALAENVTDRDAPFIARLRAAGAIVLGKTNLSQWANIRSSHSTSGWSSVGGLAKNPYALDRNTCGSSAGSGAAAAASLAGGTIGTETDGSITCPASTNGVVGFKPTVGMVSRTHVVPISHSQDTAGPMTRTVTGAAMMLSAMAGSDPDDPATAQADEHRADFTQGLDPHYLSGVRIGVLRDRIGEHRGTVQAFEEALKTLEGAGAVLVDIEDSRSGLDGMGKAEFKVLMVELKADMNAYLATLPEAVKTRTLADLIAYNKAHADTELRWFGQDLFEQAQSQPDLDSEEYSEALATSRRLAREIGIDRLLGEHKVRFLIGPTRSPAWPSDLVSGDSFSGPSQSALPAIAGYPHITVPMAMVEGLPVGISIIGAHWDDHAVLKAGYAFEQASKARVAPSYFANLPLMESDDETGE